MDGLTSTAEHSPEARLACLIAHSPDGQARDAEAELYRLLAPRIRRYGLRHLRDSHAAADLMQHVMMLTIEQLRSGRVREPERVVSFVLGSCRMTVMDQYRTDARRNELLRCYADALPLADIHVPDKLDHERVAECLERLPERERSVIVLTFFDEQPSDAVGAQLGLSPANVRVIRHRGIDKLRRCVDAGRSRG